MSKCIEQLKDTLIKENELYTQVLKLGEKKTEVVVSRNIKELDNITKKEQQYIMNMGTFEKIRRSIFSNIAEELNIKKPESISELILSLEEDTGNEIDNLRNDLLETIDKIKKKNEDNEKLINQSLEYVNFNLELMTDSPEERNKYSNKASENKKSKSISFFDMKI